MSVRGGRADPITGSMAKLQSIGTDIDSEMMALVGYVGQRRGIGSHQFPAEAIRRGAKSNNDFGAFVQAAMRSRVAMSFCAGQ